ncbi:MAG: DUF4214 domain-containing protein [Bdellovibrionia bacterium]
MKQVRTLMIVSLFACTGCMGNVGSSSYLAQDAKVAGNVSSVASSATPMEVFLAHLYQTALNRSPDSAGLNYWNNAYRAGVSCSTIALGILQSSENILRNELLSNSTDPMYAALYVQELYGYAFNRAADQAGSSFWISALQSGVSVQSVESGFLTSSEFKKVCQTYGL